MNYPSISLDNFLHRKFTPGSAKRYAFAIKKYLDHTGDMIAEHARHSDIIKYISHLREIHSKKEYVLTEFYGIKNYYKWLLSCKQRLDDPTEKIKLSDLTINYIQFQMLFTEAELELLLKRKNRYDLQRWRNYFAISLYVYQGLTSGEIASLSIYDIDEKNQSLSVIGDRNNSRILFLKPNQFAAYKRYIEFERPFLLKQKSEILFIGKLGNCETIDGLHYLIESQRNLFPGRKLNPKTIRQSVIVNLLKNGMSLLKVQYFAGHKCPSTTERYKQDDISHLREEMDRLDLF